MEGASPRGQPLTAEFDVSAAERARYAVDKDGGTFFVVMGSVALAAAVGWTLVWVIYPPSPPVNLIAFVWVFLGVMCPILIGLGMRWREPREPATRLLIDQEGVVLERDGGRVLVLSWFDPATRFWVRDLRSGGRMWRGLPMLLRRGGQQYGLSREAGESVLAAFQRHGVPVEVQGEWPAGIPVSWAVGVAPDGER